MLSRFGLAMAFAAAAAHAAGYFYAGQWGAPGDWSEPGRFYYASRVAISPDGYVYVCDRWGIPLQSFTADGRLRWTREKYAPEKKSYIFLHPHGVAAAPDGTVVVTDSLCGVAARFSAAGELLGYWLGPAGEGEPAGESEPGGWTGAAVAPDGSVYICDERTDEVLRFAADGTLEGRWGEKGRGPGQLKSPGDVAVAADGTVYVADKSNARIQYFTPEGDLIGQWGEDGEGPGQFDGAEGLGVAPDGTVFVADRYNNRIQYFTANGTYLGEWGSAGMGWGEFNEPTDVAVNADGIVYVVDAANHRIQYFHPGTADE